MIIKFNYTDGYEFLDLNGDQYVGYFNVNENNVAYETRDTQDKQLTKQSNFSGEYNSNIEYFKDRTLLEKMSLPYNLNHIEIGSNEIVNYNTINSKLNYLHNNLIYLYSKLFIGSTNVPIGYSNILGLSANTSDFNWYTVNKSTVENFQAFTNSIDNKTDPTKWAQYPEFDKLKKFVVMKFDDGTGYGILGISSTHLIGLTSNSNFTSANVTLYTSVVDNYSELPCLNLQDIAFSGSTVFVTDSEINGGGQLYSYDASGFTDNDTAHLGQRYLKEVFGGTGGSQNTLKFNGAKILGTSPNYVLVDDSGNKVIKIYDHSLVWKTTIKLASKYTVLDIKHRELTDSYFVLVTYQIPYTNGLVGYDTKFDFIEYDSNFKLIVTHTFEDNFLNQGSGAYLDISFYQLAFSYQDSNVFYVTTRSSVYKKFFTKPEKTFAILKREETGENPLGIWNTEFFNYSLDKKPWSFHDNVITNPNINSIALLKRDDNADDIFCLYYGRIRYFKEYTDYFNVINNPVIDCYNSSDFNLNPNEYVQAFSFNRVFYYIYKNLFQIKNNIEGRFTGKYSNFSVLEYTGPQYITNAEFNDLQIDINYNTYINDNELVNVKVINRILVSLFKQQEKLLNLTQAKLLNSISQIDITTAIEIA